MKGPCDEPFTLRVDGTDEAIMIARRFISKNSYRAAGRMQEQLHHLRVDGTDDRKKFVSVLEHE